MSTTTNAPRRVETNAGYVSLTGQLDDAADTCFTRGHCHSLALAIHEKTGWPLVGDDWMGWDDTPSHVAVRTPDNLILDVQGLHEPEDWEEQWGSLRDVDADEAYAAFDGDYRDPDLDLARPYADLILAEHGLAA